MKAVRAIILFADIGGSTEFGYTQCLEMHNEMLRDFHKTCHKAIRRFRRDNRLGSDRVTASCRGDECCVFLSGGETPEDELFAMNLAVYLKEMWKQSRFCRLNWKAARTGLIPQVDLRIGIGSGEVAMDHDVWSDTETLEGIRISEAKRIEGMADAASDTLIMVKLDIMEACIQAGENVEFGPRMRLQGKGVPDVVETAVYPVKTYREWSAIQKRLVPSPKTYFEGLAHAMALRRSGDLEEAIKEYGELLKLRPNDPDVLNDRGIVLDDLRRYEEALADYSRSLELRPDHPAVLSNRGVTLVNLGRYREALGDFNRSLELRPDYPDALINRGIALRRLKRHQEALADYTRALELRPDDPDTLSNRGVALRDLGRHQEALADYTRALELRPDYPDTLGNRGIALGYLQRYEEALAEYHRVLELQPDHRTTPYNIACLYSLWGRYAESLQWLKKAIDRDASYRAKAAEDEDFAGLRADPEFGPRFEKLVQEENP